MDLDDFKEILKAVSLTIIGIALIIWLGSLFGNVCPVN